MFLKGKDYQLTLEGDKLGTIEITDLNGQGPVTYRAQEVHFNGPAEHKINSKRHAMELQILHTLENPD